MKMKARKRERERESVDGAAADPLYCIIIELIIKRGLVRQRPLNLVLVRQLSLAVLLLHGGHVLARLTTAGLRQCA
mgnify:CR=1 FL=1